LFGVIAPGPFQLKVAPPVEELPVNVTVSVVQVIVWFAPMLMLGRARLELTAAMSVAVQPLTGFVTVNV
jgi:hypothetical protein